MLKNNNTKTLSQYIFLKALFIKEWQKSNYYYFQEKFAAGEK